MMMMMQMMMDDGGWMMDGCLTVQYYSWVVGDDG